MPKKGYQSFSFSDADIALMNKVRAEWKRKHGVEISIPELCRLAVAYYAQRRGFVEAENDNRPS